MPRKGSPIVIKARFRNAPFLFGRQTRYSRAGSKGRGWEETVKLKKLAAAAAFSLVLALGLAPGLAQADEQGGDFTAGNLTTQFDAQSLEDATVTGVSGSYYYTGEEITPTPVVVLD